MTSDLTQGKIIHHIRALAIPASIGMIFNTLYNVVDTFYSGKIGTDSMAGLAVSFPIFFIIIAISYGLGSGTTALSSIAVGLKDEKKFHSLIKNSLYLALIISVMIMVFAPSFSALLFGLSGATGNTLAEGSNYMNTLIYGSIFFILNFIINGGLYAQGDTKSYRNALIFGFFMNLILDPLFIYGFLFIPKLGTIGIALATVIVQIITSIYLLIRLFKSPLFNISLFKSCKFSSEDVKELLKQGIPSSLNSATIAIGVFIVNYFILRYSTEVTMAAYGAAMRIEQMALLPVMGLNSAALTITGQNYGANLNHRIVELKKIALRIGVFFMLISGVVIYAFAPFFISIFNDGVAVVEAGTIYLRIGAFALPTYVILSILLSIMQGIKKPTFAVYIGLYRQILMPLPLFYLLANVLGFGVKGIWWGIVFLTWSSVAGTYLYSKRQLDLLCKSN